MERLNTDTQNLKKFALGMCIALSIVGTVLWLRNKQVFIWFYWLALLFLGLGVFAANLLKPVYIFWMRFAYILAWINTRVILTIVFFFIFTPMGIILRLFRKDPLRRSFNKTSKSYWKTRESIEFNPQQYARQF